MSKNYVHRVIFNSTRVGTQQRPALSPFSAQRRRRPGQETGRCPELGWGAPWDPRQRPRLLTPRHSEQASCKDHPAAWQAPPAGLQPAARRGAVGGGPLPENASRSPWHSVDGEGTSRGVTITKGAFCGARARVADKQATACLGGSG